MNSISLERVWHRLKVQRTLALGALGFTFFFRRVTRTVRGRFDLARPGAGSGRRRIGGRAGDAAAAMLQAPDRQGLPQPASVCPGQPLPALGPLVPPLPTSDRQGLPQAGELPGPGVAVIVGVGPGFGHALARCLAQAGHDLVLVSRGAHRLDPLVSDIQARWPGVQVHSLAADATDDAQVNAAFVTIAQRLGPPALVVYAIEETAPGDTLSISSAAFESCWRSNCLGAFHVCKAAALHMAARGQGSILIIGSTSSIIGRERHLSQAVGKFGRRALAQVMARELWAQGIHVAHVLIDADIAESAAEGMDPTQSDPAEFAQTLLALHRQGRSAWTFEIDLRPWNERFWEHC